MSATKHTPGPWEYERDLDPKDLPRPWIGHLATQRYSALACGETFEEAIANARLIAAAPELYRCTDLLDGLCTWLLHAFGPDGAAGKEAAFRQREALAALAKARGDD